MFVSFLFLSCIFLTQSYAQGVDRFILYEADTTDLTCDAAFEDAEEECADWAAKMNSESSVVQPATCPVDFCSCDPRGLKKHGFCLGFGKFHDDREFVGKEVSDFQTFSGTSTKSCEEATYLAMEQMGDWAEDVASAHPMEMFSPSKCECSGAMGVYSAGCSVLVNYRDSH